VAGQRDHSPSGLRRVDASPARFGLRVGGALVGQQRRRGLVLVECVNVFNRSHAPSQPHHTCISSWEAMGSEACTSLTSLHGKRYETRLAPHLPLFMGSDMKRGLRLTCLSSWEARWEASACTLRACINWKVGTCPSSASQFFCSNKPCERSHAAVGIRSSTRTQAHTRTRSKEGPSPIAVSTSIASRKRLA